MADAILSAVVQVLFHSIVQQISYPFNYRRRIEELQYETAALADARSRLEHYVAEAASRGEGIQSHVEAWLREASAVIEKANGLIADQGLNASRRCFVGLCPDLKTRYRVGRRAARTALEVSDVRNEGRFDLISYRAAVQQIVYAPASNFDRFPSRMSILNRVVDALKDPAINIVGLYGLGGVGKTTLVKEVHRRAIGDSIFDVVVMVTVSATPDLRAIQEQIADFLGLKFDVETEVARADRLYQRLKRAEMVLLILDDVWEPLNLEAVGIPFGGDRGVCKILLTSRNRRVLREMNTQRDFMLDMLPFQEAWSLFKMRAGNEVEDPSLQPIATEIVRQCGGFPIQLVVVASALRGKEIIVWWDALSRLSRSDELLVEVNSEKSFAETPRLIERNQVTFPDGWTLPSVQIPRPIAPFEMERVLPSLEMSYDRLVSEEIKSIFLLCGFQGKSNICIRDLLKYSLGLRLLKFTDTVNNVRNRLRTIIGHLKDSCLLLDGDSNEFVRMDDIVQLFAASVASRSLHAFVIKSVVGLNESRNKNSTRIVLADCDMRDLPAKLELPELELLLLFSKHHSSKIPDTFFEGMEKMKVLNVTRMLLSPLPPSLRFLTNLCTLSLDKCILHDIAVIGELKKLEILSLSGSSIVNLPKELGQLIRLKLFDLSNCFKLKVIPKNVISSFSLLEELYLGDSFVQWEVEGLKNQSNANLTELQLLSHLTSLEIRVLDSEMLPKTWFSNELESYRIYIGDDWHWDGACESSRKLKLKFIQSTHLKHGVTLLKKAEDLYLDEVEGIKNVLPDLDREGFQEMKHLYVQNCAGLQYTIDSTGEEPSHAWPLLESLSLYNLLDLEKFCNGQLPPSSFSKLKIIIVSNCGRLNYLFPSFLVRGLLQLQQMEVSDCVVMEEIVAGESEGDDEEIEVVEFAQLQSLKLHGLPQVKTFFSPTMMAPNFETTSEHLIANQQPEGIVSESELDDLLPLFHSKVSFPNLEQLKLSSISCKNLWHYQRPGVPYTLKSLVVEGCRNLKHLLTSSLAKDLRRLEELEVCDCEFMETIIDTEDFVKEKGTNRLVFSNLHTLKLKNLSNVTNFFNGYRIECPSLKKLLIERCPVLKGFVSSSPGVEMMVREEDTDFYPEKNVHPDIHPLFDEKVVFPALEEMEISYIDCLKSIWKSEQSWSSFYELKTMKITHCKNLQTLFPANVLDRLQRIEKLWVSHCDSLVEIYELHVTEISGVAAFSLTELHISDLSSLEHIWTKDPQGSVTFKNLFSVDVSNCKLLKNIFPTSIARDLGQLEKLAISSCGVKEVVAMAEDVETSRSFIFDQLTSLKLSDLPEILCLYPGRHFARWPKLKCLKLSGCDKVTKFYLYRGAVPEDVEKAVQQDVDGQKAFFLTEEIVPNLEELLLEPQDLQNWNFLLELISEVKVLELHSFHLQSEVPLFRLLLRLPTSAKLVVSKSSLREIFSIEGPYVDGHLQTLSQIKKLEIYDLQEGVQLELDFRYLESLRVSFCDTLNILAPSSASFRNLFSLEVWNCNGIKSLITSSVAKSMVHLEKMSIKDCRAVQDIIMDDGEQIQDGISFGKLEYLSLISLPGLTSFCSKNCRLLFPSLEKFTVELCPKLWTFSLGELIMPMLETIQLKENSSDHIVCRDDNINAVIGQLFVGKVQNKLPAIIKASEIPEMQENWQGQLPLRRLHDVKILLVDECTSFYAVSTNLLQSLNSLQVLIVENCDSIEKIFDLPGLNSDEQHTRLVSPLDELRLIDLPCLRNVWNGSPQGIVSFVHLTCVKVHNCGSLKNIFTLRVALDLVQLQYVEVKSCPSVEEIITKGEEEAVQDQTIFPSLCSIVLECLPSLKSFYSGSDVLQWSSLKKIDVIDCPIMKTFASTSFSTVAGENMKRMHEGEFGIPVGPLSWGKVVVPSLQALRLDWNCIMKEIWDENFQADFLSSLKVIELKRVPKEHAQFLSKFFQRFPNLEKLVLSDSSFEHLSLHEGDLVEEEYVQSMVRLRKLKLSELPNLELLVGEDRNLVTIYQHLETLEVFECSRLEVLVPSSVSFHNLTFLEVVKCHGLVNLLTAATARSLVLLTRMTISDCQMIQQIVEGDDVEDDITFSRLRTLELCGLPSLTGFCSGNHIFDFPSLDEMVVIDCPRMDMEAKTL